MPGLIRVGHKGADHVAPGNTVESFEAALAHGVHMIEFDILRTRDGRLVLAHDYNDADGRECLTLEEGLDHFAGEAYNDVRLDVDLKLAGYEQVVVDGLRERGLLARSLISSAWEESLETLGEIAPGVQRGWSVPRVRRDWTRTAVAPLAYAVVLWWRAAMPSKAAAALRAGECEALMAHWMLVTPRLVRSVQENGGELYVWTVDDPKRIAELEEMGVDAVITNDPRLFD
jgi:glycerophosphoryl diester phosphodiesterase